MVTKEQAMELKHGDIVFDKIAKNANGTPAVWRVNGKIKLWKRSPERFSLPLKHGLWDYAYLDEDTALYFVLSVEEARSGL